MREEGTQDVDLATLGPTSLGSNAAKSLFSQGYLQLIASEARTTVMFTQQDQDINAIDAQLDFLEAPLRVQLKCTSSLTITDRGLRFQLKKEWIRKWRRSPLPVYLLVIVLGRDTDWIRHEPPMTIADATAYWARVDTIDPNTPSILISPDNTVDNTTIASWFDDFVEGGLA